MSDDRSTFEVTRARLEDIVTQVRRKDVSLEASLDLLEEAVRLVNQCNDLIDQTSLRHIAADEAAESEGVAEVVPVEPAVAAVSEVVVVDEDGDLEAEFFVTEIAGEIEDDERE